VVTASVLAVTAGWSTIFIALAGSGGVVGAIVTVVKLRGDTESAAVSQSQGASAALAEALEAVERERDYWKERFEKCHKEKSGLYADLYNARRSGPTDPN
jgi:hypothetical protein